MRRWISNAWHRRRPRHAQRPLELAPMPGPAGPAAVPTVPYADVDGQPPWELTTGEAFLGRSGAPLDGTRPAWLWPAQPGGWISGGGWPDEEDSGAWRRRMASELAPGALDRDMLDRALDDPPGPAFTGLGPNAARVLAAYRQRFAERWAYVAPAQFDTWVLA